jgi:tRNA 5-methylaminomethyl-2-thiouridine biosynthesis bifunctional protein
VATARRLHRPLLEQYVAIHPGFQQFSLAGGRVTLTLLIGDALEQLPQLDAQIDAWFLDGFAPAKNPDMWTPELFAQLARLSHPARPSPSPPPAGFAALVEAGFTMKKVPGIGKKWEVMRGHYSGPGRPARPWYARPAAPPARAKPW